MTKHTPLPWHFTYDGDQIPQAAIYSGNIGDETFVAEIPDGLPPLETYTNAEFIVRACNAHDELLDVCQRLHAAMMDGHHIAPYEYRAVLGDAIAKATQ